MTDKLFEQLQQIKPAASAELWQRIDLSLADKQPVGKRFFWSRLGLLSGSLAGACALVLVLVVSVGVLQHNQHSNNGASTKDISAAGGSSGISKAMPGASGAATDSFANPVTGKAAGPDAISTTPPIVNSDPAAGQSDRKVVYSANISLSSKGNKIDKLANDVTRTAQQYNAYILSAQVDQNQDGGQAYLQISVPAAKRDQLITALSRLGKLDSISRTSTDVTSQVGDLNEQLDELKATRSSLLAEPSSTKNKAHRQEIIAELKDLRGQADSVRAQQKQLNDQVSYSQVGVTINAGQVDAPAVRDGKWGLADAWQLAKTILTVTASVALLLLLVLGPWIILMIGVYLIVKARRRRRDQKLLEQ